MKQLLEEPVQYGDLLLAPTVELAGLAELSVLRDIDERAAALKRIADAVAAEDEARAHLARHRSGDIELVDLPRRR
ncbi:MAG: hypothetical protein U0Q07_08270 [Acidimicrobiales bacterium]